MSVVEFNVTIDPRSPATSVDDPEITEVIDLISGEILSSKAFIAAHEYGALIEARVEMRAALQSNKPRHICAICATSVYLVASKQKRFFFRHRTEDGSCPAVTRGALTQEEIRARKYRGLRESEAHKRIKSLIERSLRADPSFVAESIHTEKRWNSTEDPERWRKPDVQAASSQGRFAFEAQLSTTFLDVVVSRRLFYQRDGAHLVWVLANFSPDYRRMTTDDLLFSNNSNIFVVDDETVRISEESKRFHLRCHYRVPVCERDDIEESWCESIVPFAELTKELQRQRIFHFDFEAAKRECESALDQRLREDVIFFWKENVHPRFVGAQSDLDHWNELRERLTDRAVAVPEHPTGDGSFRNLMICVLSALEGRAVGWQFETLIQCAHQTAQAHPENLLIFGFAIEVSGHRTLLESQDVTGKWERRCKKNREELRNRNLAFVPRAEWLSALSFLFPEIGRRVIDFLRRNELSV